MSDAVLVLFAQVIHVYIVHGDDWSFSALTIKTYDGKVVEYLHLLQINFKKRDFWIGGNNACVRMREKAEHWKFYNQTEKKTFF